MKPAILSVLLSLWIGPAVLSAAESPTAYRAQADTNVQVATQLVEEAQALLRSEVTTEKMRLAVSLYTRAGQLFEQAATMYQALGPQYATKGDVENSHAAVQSCVQAISEIKARLG